MSRLRARPSRRPSDAAAPFIPADPTTLGVALDPALGDLRTGLAGHRRRLWLRRSVRRAWYVLAAVMVAELVLAIAQRLLPLEAAPLIALAIPVVGLVVLLVLVVRSPADDRRDSPRGGRRGRVRRCRRLCPGVCGGDAGCRRAGRRSGRRDDRCGRGLRRRRCRGAVHPPPAARRRGRLRAIDPRLFRPRLARRPALVALVGRAARRPRAPAAQPDGPRDPAQPAGAGGGRSARPSVSTRSPRASRARAPTSNDPRSELAEELRQLAERLRTNPGDLEQNLAQLGAVEDDVRSRLDPANEQKAASIAALSRALSRTATGDPKANPGGDPKETKEDLGDLGDKVDEHDPGRARPARTRAGRAPGPGEPGGWSCRAGAARRGGQPHAG